MSDFETNQTQSLVNSIKENADALGLKWQLRVATVVFNANGIAAVVYDGDESDVDGRAVPLVEGIYADDRVMVMHVPPSGNYIIGYAAAALGRGPGGRIATATETADSSTFTAETVIGTITATLSVGRVYRVRCNASVGSSVVADTVLIRLREDDILGTQIHLNTGAVYTTGNIPVVIPVEAEYTAVTTGSKTFVVTAQRLTGTGNIRREALTNWPQLFYIEHVRG